MQWSDTGGTEFEQPPVGSHVARCIKIIDIGTQKGEYQGQPNYKRQVIIAWELPTELITTGDYAGKPFSVSKFYTASLSEKANLRKDLANWRGRDFTPEELQGFDSKNILGKACMLSVIHNDKKKARVSGVMQIPKGLQVPEQVNETLFFSLDAFDQKVYDSLSDGYKRMIELSPEYQHLKHGVSPSHDAPNGGGQGGDYIDDIPFAPIGRGISGYSI